MPALTRYEIHELVLRQDRELVIEETKLRAVGLSRTPVKDRLGPRNTERLGNTSRDHNAPPADHGGRLPEKRNCNECHKRGHLAYACPDRTPSPSDAAPTTKGEMGEAKRATPDTPDNEGKPSTRARTAATERANNSNTRGAGGGGGRSNSYSGGGRNAYDRKSKVGSHSTVGAVCAHCGRENHTDAQCWKLHPELNPYAARAETANMVRIADEDQDNNRQWEAEQLAREQRSQRYEKVRETRTTLKEEKEEADEPEGRFQYMVTPHAFATEESPERNDAAEEAERELAYLDQQEILILYE